MIVEPEMCRLMRGVVVVVWDNLSSGTIWGRVDDIGSFFILGDLSMKGAAGPVSSRGIARVV